MGAYTSTCCLILVLVNPLRLHCEARMLVLLYRSQEYHTEYWFPRRVRKEHHGRPKTGHDSPPMGRTSSELETCLKRNLSILELLERLCVLLAEKTSVKLDVMEEKFCIHHSKSVQTAVHRLHYEHPRFLLLEGIVLRIREQTTVPGGPWLSN